MGIRVALMCALIGTGCGKKDGGEAESARPSAPAVVFDAASAAKPASAFAADEVTFQSGDRTISGTLTRPTAPGRHPAVLLHAGSGNTDRDWLNPGMPGTNGSGKLLAEELSRRGLVVLRFDKIGTGKTTLPVPLSWDAVLADAAAGLALLRASEHVDAEKLFLAGHSEGGTQMIGLALREAKAGNTLRGLVLLASNGRALGKLLFDQLEGQFKATGLSGAALEAEVGPIRDALDAFFAGKDVDPTKVSKHVSVQQLLAGLMNPVGAAYARELYGFDPAKGLSQLALPVLVWNGGKDIQVSPELDAKVLHAAASRSGRVATLHISPDADHVIKHEPKPAAELTTLNAMGYNRADRSLDTDAVDAIGAWLDEQARAPATEEQHRP